MPRREPSAVVGLAELPPARYTDGETTLSLSAKAARMAIDDAGLELREVDGLITHPMGSVPMLVPSTVAELIGLRVRYADSVDLGGATAAGMVWRAAAAIAAGMCHTVVCVTAASRSRRNDRTAASPRSQGPRERSAFTEFEVPYGAVGANFGYALIAARYEHEHGDTAKERARVAVHQRANACANPMAIFHSQPITEDDVLASEIIADPLRMLEIVMPSGGAAGLVVTSADRAAASPHPPAWLLGAGEVVTHRSLPYAPDITNTAIRPAADAAFASAGVTRQQIGLASVYDCYTITVLLTLEDAGFCDKGAAPRFVADHDLRWHGDFPINTHGGQLSFGQAGYAGGMSHVVEAVRQLQNRAERRQIPDLDLTYVHGNGGIMSEQVGLILGRQK